MKKLAPALALIILALCIFGCTPQKDKDALPTPVQTDAEQTPPVSSMPEAAPSPAAAASESIDYAASVKPSGADTAKQEVTVKSFVDGDTVHFFVPESIMPSGVLKARFIGIDTPESTGKIEEYGKAASEFTKEKLSRAHSIMIESDDGNWDFDSTGGRYLVWVWYKAEKAGEYRNLNIELLQNGLARAYSSANNRYGSACTAAINQAKANKLNIYSGQKDPNFYYGDAVELTLKELRCGIEGYNGKKVAFEGVITINSGNGVFIEDYDAETDRYYGISAYYGYGLSGAGLDILSVGNRARIVGTVQYYEAGGCYQVSGLSYRQMKPDDPNNLQKLSEGNAAGYVSISADDFASAMVSIETEAGAAEYKLSDIAMNTTVEMDGLTVQSVYVAENGCATLTCAAGDAEVTVRLEPLKVNGEAFDPNTISGKTIDVRAAVDMYDNAPQLHVFTAEGISIH
ncbi:nuclease-like protein [Clostridium sp. CAG:226]|jgi:endonuclease YncB( thermonuclease family)|nr:nuclease-like protein [Clostridium sp. CAG:226]